MNTPTDTARMFDRLGLELPAASVKAMATLTALRTAANYDPAADVWSLKLTDKTAADALHDLAQQLTIKEKNHQALNLLEQPVSRAFAAGLRDNYDTVIAALGHAFIEPAAIAQAAGEHFRPDAPAEDIVAGGVEAVAVWHQLSAALSTLGLIRSLRFTMGELVGEEQDVTWWIADIEDGDDLDRARGVFMQAGNAFHNLAHAGFTLALNGKDAAAALVEKAESTGRKAVFAS